MQARTFRNDRMLENKQKRLKVTYMEGYHFIVLMSNPDSHKSRKNRANSTNSESHYETTIVSQNRQ